RVTTDRKRIRCERERQLSVRSIERLPSLFFDLAAISELRVPRRRRRCDLAGNVFQVAVQCQIKGAFREFVRFPHLAQERRTVALPTLSGIFSGSSSGPPNLLFHRR